MLRSQLQQPCVWKDIDIKINIYVFKLKYHYDSFVPKQRKSQANNLFLPNFLYELSAQIFFQQTENKTDVNIPGGQQGVSFYVFQAKYCVFQILKRPSWDIYVFLKMGFSTEYQGKFPLHCAVHRSSENFQSKNGLKVLQGNNGEGSVQKEFLLLLLSQNCLTASKSFSVSKLTWLGKTLQHSYVTKTDWKVSLCSLWLQP